MADPIPLDIVDYKSTAQRGFILAGVLETSSTRKVFSQGDFAAATLINYHTFKSVSPESFDKLEKYLVSKKTELTTDQIKEIIK